MKKSLLALLLAALMTLTLAACGGDTGTDQTDEAENNTDTQQNETQQQDENAAQPEDTLAQYGLTLDAVTPDADYGEVTAAENNWGGYTITFPLESDVDAETYNTQVFEAIAAISDDGQLYPMDSEFSAETGTALTLDTADVAASTFQWGYLYNGQRILVSGSISPDVTLGFSLLDAE